MAIRHRSSSPAHYRIKLKASLDAIWPEHFDDMALSHAGGVTTLIGQVADQAALHGLLIRIRDLNLNLLLVERIDPGLPEE